MAMKNSLPTSQSGMRYDRLVAPAVSLLAVVVLLIGAKTYEAWPVKPLPCSLRTLSGVPCLGCGGTRAMKALARGEIAEAAQFNPMVVVAVFLVLAWFIWTVATMKMARYQRGASVRVRNSSPRRLGRWGWGVIIVLAVLNWIYLICYLPR